MRKNVWKNQYFNAESLINEQRHGQMRNIIQN